MKILVTMELADELVEQIRQVGEEVEVIRADSVATAIEAIGVTSDS